MRTNKTIKIIGTVGLHEERALLCEIPRNLARNFKINPQGFIDGDLNIDALDLIKLIRRAYIQDLDLERSMDLKYTLNKTLDKTLDKPIDQKQAQEQEHEQTQRRDFLYAMIFDGDLAVSPIQFSPNDSRRNSQGASSWN